MKQTLGKNTIFPQKLYDWLPQVAKHPIVVPLCLLAIAVTGAFLRVYKLDEWSFWGDEMFTVSDQEDGFNYNLFRQSLSVLLIQKVIAVNGLNEWNARIVPVFIGIVTIPILFFIVRKLFDTPAALLAALLLALSPWHLYWSQNARFYTALLLFYSLALFFFYLGLEQDNPLYLFLCLLFLGLGAKERLLALFFIPVILIYILLLYILSFKKPSGWRYRNLAILSIPALLGAVFFAGPYLLNLSSWMSGFGFANNNPFWLTGSFAYYVGLPVICLGGAGGVYLVVQKHRVGLLLFVSAVVPLLLLAMISPFHYTASRYVFISLTSWLILAAVSAVTLIKNANGMLRLLALGTLLILIAHPISEDALYYRFQNGNRDNWRAAFAYIAQHRRPSDLVASGSPQLANYYLSAPSIFVPKLNLDEVEAGDQRIWFVEDLGFSQKFPKFYDWMIQNAQLVSIHDVSFQARIFTMRVYLFDPVENVERVQDEQ
jgi:mannosyltransferase